MGSAYYVKVLRTSPLGGTSSHESPICNLILIKEPQVRRTGLREKKNYTCHNITVIYIRTVLRGIDKSPITLPLVGNKYN